MKDESKAKWPEKMIHRISPNGIVCSFYDDEGCLKGEVICNLYDIDKDALAIRAKQICALPEMVALLKEAALIKEGDDYLAIVDKAKHIIAQIGEMK